MKIFSLNRHWFNWRTGFLWQWVAPRPVFIPLRSCLCRRDLTPFYGIALVWRDGSMEVSARENELLRARGWSNNADAGVAMWPCDTTCADGCGRTMNGLFDLHLLCITLRERRARSRYGRRASILRDVGWLHEPFLCKRDSSLALYYDLCYH